MSDLIDQQEVRIADLERENDALKAKVEVAESGFHQAVVKAQWQASTNAELNRLIAERDALRRDAERYRFLCETSPNCLCFMGNDYRGKAEFDAAIDAAMKEQA